MNLQQYPSAPYVVPFLVFLLFLGIGPHLPIAEQIEHPLRFAILSAVLWVVSRQVISFRTTRAIQSVLLGIAVFILWVGPDLLIPGYREHWLFQNSLTGTLKSSLSDEARSNPWILSIRSLRAIVLVPIIEELFWRAWLMRWIISSDFQKVPLGTYSAFSFWLTALLFASEHGPYWEVGLLTGVIYNWWMIRTRSLGDLILTHAVTNACLCAFVLATGRWEYWM